MHKNNSVNWVMMLSALGVVFGDIGTSPLYAINEIFFGNKFLTLTSLNILGPISLVIWSLIIIISFKYLFIVLHADHDGEGGVFALYSRLHQFKNREVHFLKILLMLAAGLLIGESIITPAISVLSSVEGLVVYNASLQQYILPLVIGILSILFFFQSKGSHFIGKVFGPLACIWFLTIGTLGLYSISNNLEILNAFNPLWAFKFVLTLKWHQVFLIFGSVMLVITGGEALFADMGHFGLSPIRRGWFLIVFPALILNYLGQGAFLLSGNAIVNNNLFYSIVPKIFLLPTVVIATMATIIASQALISGAFSLAAQAVALGLFPRIKVTHTHHDHEGQIYVGIINWFLFLSTVALVLVFKNSNSLAAAYGLSVSGVMITTTLSMIAIAHFIWHWSELKIGLIFTPILIIESFFFISNSLKFFEGGFIPILIGIGFFIVMRVWRWGRKATFRAYNDYSSLSIRDLLELKNKQQHFIEKNVVLFVPRPLRSIDDKTPALVQLFYNRYGLFPRNLFLIEVVHRKTPVIHGTRYESYVFQSDKDTGVVASTTIHFGFMEEPNVESVLEELAAAHEIALPADANTWLIHVAHEKLIPNSNMSLWGKMRFKLFLHLRQITQAAYFYYGLGNDVNLSVDILPIKLND